MQLSELPYSVKKFFLKSQQKKSPSSMELS